MHSARLKKGTAVSLTEGSIWKGLLLFSIPLMLSNLFQQLYNTIDTAVVGVYAGNEALAAVGSTGALIQLLVGFFLGIATGAGVLYGTYFGARDPDNMRRIGGGSMLLGIICGAVLTVAGLIWTPQMLKLMSTPDDVMAHAITYLRIYFIGVIPMMIYNVGAGLIRAAGDSTKPLIYLVIGGVMNLVLDIYSVAVLKMGVAGAAWATVISQLASAVLVCMHLMRAPADMRLGLRDLRLTRYTAWQISKISLACGLQSAMYGISNLLVQIKINTFGSIAMAGVAAYSKIDGFVYMPTMAISLAVSTYASQNVGAGKLDRVKQGTKVSLLMGVGTAMLVGGIVLLTGDFLLGFFTDSPEVKACGLEMMWFMAPFAWLCCIQDVLGGTIRGAGAATPVTIISAMCICVFRVVWLTVMLMVWRDLKVVYMCYMLSWTIASICMTIYYFKGHWLRPMSEAVN